MTNDPHSEMPHEPAEPEPRKLMPEPEALVRGLALTSVAVTGILLGRGALRASWLLAPVAAVFGAASVLAGWAAAIQLTGGEKRDDHPFV